MPTELSRPTVVVAVVVVVVVGGVKAGEIPGTHCIGGWVEPRVGPDGYGRSRLHRDSIPGPSSPYRVAIPSELSRPTVIIIMLRYVRSFCYLNGKGRGAVVACFGQVSNSPVICRTFLVYLWTRVALEVTEMFLSQAAFCDSTSSFCRAPGS